MEEVVEKVDETTLKITPAPVTTVTNPPEILTTLDKLMADRQQQQDLLDAYTLARQADMARFDNLIAQAEALGVLTQAEATEAEATPI